ncbi:hypothetical protein NSA47_11730 [Irregularibacter muris]|uniref:YhfM-like domain-containing protein n=1 Tax=Irregularibacter muris TaxID=1796619 RepID=A0AAE3HHT4_9FIRM|nr:hypothetical protein [Irregularibacter muris]MCR1899645.1 hypothetical protein [Irregularibacter muris]
MKKLLLGILVIYCTTLLFGCQSPKEMKLLGEIKEISISEFYKYGGTNEEYFASINQPESLSKFKEIVENAEKRDNNTSKVDPNYDLRIEYENGDIHILHMLLGHPDQESALMYAGNENKVFYISSEATAELRKILPVEEKNNR